ncbi:hypothetical protein EDB92DRAFT_382374 [Lactarius akahatsu]|uniref:Uncharacterized protein n=1 Tax=Lactarius akahatsu TaxID=416441 RepID=A0AAD4L7H7_9AGAM|nr:hypothetical protein EDB92DRAFT_189045 [Lactarius akahatsu]KAH8993797.1 hypothetical protein EDB92DRAFT_382374 [Lactarius akahatsu]
MAMIINYPCAAKPYNSCSLNACLSHPNCAASVIIAPVGPSNLFVKLVSPSPICVTVRFCSILLSAPLPFLVLLVSKG